MPRSTLGDRSRWLAGCQVFAPLDEADRIELARRGRVVRFPKGRTVMRRGEPADFLLLLRAGRLEVRRDTEGGDPIVLRSLGRGALLGLSTAAGAPATADVVAAEAVEALLLPGATLRELVGRRPEVALRSLAHLADLLGRLTDELEEGRSLGLEDRLLAALRREGRGLRELRLTHAELAARVGATRPHVSRALARLEARGRIRRARGRVELLDLG